MESIGLLACFDVLSFCISLVFDAHHCAFLVHKVVISVVEKLEPSCGCSAHSQVSTFARVLDFKGDNFSLLVLDRL
jgi:hypothetical protein